jgi:hypothetical protein
MITAVVSNGCSFVWGQELKNRDDRFVKIISNYFNANLHDVSMPGNCNQLICTDTIDKILNLIHNKKIPTEKIFVIINWSFLDRIGYYDHVSDSIYSVFGNLLKKEDPWILYSTKEKKIDLEKYNYIKRWYNDHGKLDYIKYSTFNYIYYLQSFLIANNIKYIFAFADNTVRDLLKLKQDYACELNFKESKQVPHRTSIETILKTIDTNYFYLDLNISRYEKLGFKLAPKGHPLEDAHAYFAEKLIAFIKEKYPNDN